MDVPEVDHLEIKPPLIVGHPLEVHVTAHATDDIQAVVGTTRDLWTALADIVLGVRVDVALHTLQDQGLAALIVICRL